jgi:hypothetical protein
MYENDKEIISESLVFSIKEINLRIRTKELMFIAAIFGTLYYLRNFVNSNIHLWYYGFYGLLCCYFVFPVPHTKMKKNYNTYLTWCYRILTKWREEK